MVDKIFTDKTRFVRDTLKVMSLPCSDRWLYNFEVQKANAGWLIDYIATANYD